MTTKLTLSVDKRIIEGAKRFAREHDRSLSDIVTKYLKYLTDNDGYDADIDPMVLDISDDISSEELTRAGDAKYEYLRDKYLNA